MATPWQRPWEAHAGTEHGSQGEKDNVTTQKNELHIQTRSMGDTFKQDGVAVTVTPSLRHYLGPHRGRKYREHDGRTAPDEHTLQNHEHATQHADTRQRHKNEIESRLEPGNKRLVMHMGTGDTG